MISWERYEEIKTRVSEVFEDYEPKGLPIDIFGLAKSMEIKIIYASEMLKKNIDINIYDILSLPNSFLHYYDKDGVLVVYIDDVGCKRNRQRFSLGHELGHIILDHTEQSPENEEEANFVAEYLLTPTSLVMVEGAEIHMQDPVFLEYAFDVSLDVASISADHMENRFFLNVSTYKYEDIINNMYKDSLRRCIKKYGNYK